MKRAALLIEASQVEGLSDLPGARVDVEAWKSFLSSPMGGAWEDSEIWVLRTPTIESLTSILALFSNYEYILLAFSGHGYHLRGGRIDETRICLKGKKELSVGSLNNGVPKMTIVVDACREVHLLEKKEFIAAFAADELRSRMVGLDRVSYRNRYNDQIKIAPAGVEILYSCDLNEAANETSNGGIFTQSLIRVGEDYKERGGILTVDRAFLLAKHYVTYKYPQQHPIFEGGRRITHYPFAVCI